MVVSSAGKAERVRAGDVREERESECRAVLLLSLTADQQAKTTQAKQTGICAWSLVPEIQTLGKGAACPESKLGEQRSGQRADADRWCGWAQARKTKLCERDNDTRAVWCCKSWQRLIR